MKETRKISEKYLFTMQMIIILLIIGAKLTSCNAYKPCHVKKYYVDKSVKRAQLKSRIY